MHTVSHIWSILSTSKHWTDYEHYFLEWNITGTKMVEQLEMMDLKKEMSEWLTTPSKYAGLWGCYGC